MKAKPFAWEKSAGPASKAEPWREEGMAQPGICCQNQVGSPPTILPTTHHLATTLRNCPLALETYF